MFIKNTILKSCSTNVFVLVCICSALPVRAQVKDIIPAAEDSVLIMKEIVKEHLSKQLMQCAAYKKMEQVRLMELINDSAAIDSLGKLMLHEAVSIQKIVVNTGKSVVRDAVYTSKQLLQEQFAKLIEMQDIKGIVAQFSGIIKQPLLQFEGGSINMEGQVASSRFSNGNAFVNSSTISAGWTVLGIPANIHFVRRDLTGPEYCSRNIFSFQFDSEVYLKSLRDKIKLKIKTAGLLPDYNGALDRMKKAAVSRLRFSIDSVNGFYKGILEKQITQLGDPENLLNTDITVLQDKLISAGFLETIETNKNQLAQLQQQLNSGGDADRHLYDSLLQRVQSIEGLHEIIRKIKFFKEEVQKSNLADKLQQAERFESNIAKQWMQDPDKLKSMAKTQLDINGIQKFFLNINHLKMGMNTVNLSPLTVYQYVNNGINAAFAINKTYLFIMAGRQREFSNLFAAPVFSMGNTAMGMRIGKGDITGNHLHFSLFSYKKNRTNYNDIIVNETPGHTAVATFSSQLKLNESNYMGFELSKSAHQYDNQQNIYDTLQQRIILSKQLLSGENFLQQMALTLHWNGELKNEEFSYDLHGTGIGKRYTNPGNFFLSSGLRQLGGAFKKGFLQNQLQVSTKANYRQYGSGDNNARWRNYNFSFQGRWKLKKGRYVALHYQPYQSMRLQDDKEQNIGSGSRLSAEGNFRKRVGRINYQHAISVSALKNNYRSDTIPVNNRSFLISSLQTITINKTSYYLNMQYNRANAPSVFILFNTQLSADAGLVYCIGKSMTGSTAVNYNSTRGWFQQLCIKQTISGQVGERITLSLYGNIIKNIKEYRFNNGASTRFDWSLQYVLK